MRREMSSEERHEIARAYGDGVPIKIIIHETGRSKNAIYKVLVDLNLARRTKGRGKRANQDRI